MPERTVILASRKSRLARVQAEIAERAVIDADPSAVTAVLALSTTGDREADWSLEKEGGKGLFTKEIEDALLDGRADIAVHSAKDLPTEMPEGLVLAAFLPRADARDVLILRKGVTQPETAATGSPRRRAQLARLFPGILFSEIRGNVETRLRKIREGAADATVLAAAGLRRLGIESPEGLDLRPLEVEEMVPACGQAAIALQCRKEDREIFAVLSDAATERAVLRERAFLAALGGGCHTAYAGHSVNERFYAFHEAHGLRQTELPATVDENPEAYFREAFKDWS